ncbi:hypothetical protein ACQ27_gp124 [Klebsiella phage K64-1]|nr:hypothetical protein ACQ27_gp124 [Klebsiella phage K64-1]
MIGRITLLTEAMLPAVVAPAVADSNNARSRR